MVDSESIKPAREDIVGALNGITVGSGDMLEERVLMTVASSKYGWVSSKGSPPRCRDIHVSMSPKPLNAHDADSLAGR